MTSRDPEYGKAGPCGPAFAVPRTFDCCISGYTVHTENKSRHGVCGGLESDPMWMNKILTWTKRGCNDLLTENLG